MIKIRIAEIAEKRGLRNAFALQTALKCSPTMASKLWKGSFKQIAVETINRLCDLLDCKPSDFIVYDSDKPKTEKPVKRSEMSETAVSEGDLTTMQVAERLGLSRKRVNDYIISGELPATKGKQNHNFVSETDLQTFIAKRNEQAK